jgi:hypothetical protein
MAPRFSRRRDRAEDPDDVDDDGTTDLGADEHAWWAQREVATPWTPREEPVADEATPDVLAEHFGDAWRTSFGLPLVDAPVPTPDNEPDDEIDDEIDPSDPYAVLRVEPSATWEEIVDAHRRMARRHHPDRLFGQSEAEVAAAEEQIRRINIAYQELRVRRAR